MSTDTSPGASLLLDIWSDYVCPFCYLELPAVSHLQQRYGERLTVRWRAFELRPDPVPTLDPNGEYLHTVWNRSVYPMAAERGLLLKLPPVQPRSRKAFEAVAFAREQGKFDAMHLALFRGFFEFGVDIGDVNELLRLGEEAGLSATDLRAALDEGRFTAAVLEDQRQARDIGVTGVPLMLLRRADQPLEASIPLQGAVPAAQLLAAAQHLAGE